MLHTTTSQILQVFEDYRMPSIPTIDEYNSKGKNILHRRISGFVAAGKPVKFAMLGFPFKSTNDRDKVLGKLPDMAEEVTMQNFAQFNRRIQEVYSPGILVSMASDGYVFNELLGVDESTVQEYTEISQDMADRSNAPVEIMSLKDFYPCDVPQARERLFDDFGTTPQEIQRLILMDVNVNILYRGMIRFMEEELNIKPYNSRNQRHKAAKALTRKMMLANEAYSRLTRKELGDHIRISMHQSNNNGRKYSFQLIPGEDVRHSAWHSALAVSKSTGEYSTIHRKDALNKGYELMNQHGQPYNFVSV